ncbi:hypothetical protein NDU88_011803 [Pleurodeles waltl]|uniref:Uncharacterized protein n=1 Tax=Pleurodeles waltl TaxID=8319 RepID=A0AAV7R1F9_PLEWA|nr:hypothetical protein NDU88_011803 [Pleurodeles waltl]
MGRGEGTSKGMIAIRWFLTKCHRLSVLDKASLFQDIPFHSQASGNQSDLQNKRKGAPTALQLLSATRARLSKFLLLKDWHIWTFLLQTSSKIPACRVGRTHEQVRERAVMDCL